ncbi:hypothetical protein K458DRAFT_486505 [Lentithecium fluviatile CBS 122367]|uniref:Uncharacterized protein n=1 Tax=Lentithecium fluviatile CBS 122367 TaxID=1168545 RepID=A0A6G1J559_9PLEO|nr:hypothetical protein K458DRAFT_486505 [Lentithecium fluviatile CBS 122367]
MSGIELAGLALGAFPVVLRLLDDYRKGAKAAGDWWQIRRAYEEWKHDLDYHRAAFELNSKLILMPLMEDEELEKFINDPKAPRRTPAENIDFQKERFRLVSRGDSRTQLSAQLKEANDRLRDLVAGSDRVAAARNNRNYLRASPMWPILSMHGPEFGVLFSGIGQSGSLDWSGTKIEMKAEVDVGDIVAPIPQSSDAGRTSRRVGFVEPSRGRESPQVPKNGARPI